jgi:hypothetical protein
MRRWVGGRGASPVLIAVTLLLIVLLVVGLTAISPAVLTLVMGSTSEWERLSFIGQTYGAILSVLALIGVVATALGENRLRAISREMFQGRAGQRFWRAARDVRIATSETTSARRFHEILDEEYLRALAFPAADGDADHTDPAPVSRARMIRRAAGWAAAGIGAGIAAAIWRVRRSRRPGGRHSSPGRRGQARWRPEKRAR